MDSSSASAVSTDGVATCDGPNEVMIAKTAAPANLNYAIVSQFPLPVTNSSLL